jgi:hypothetical protein
MIMAALAGFLIVFFGGGGANGGLLTAAGVKQANARLEVVIEDPSRVAAAQETLAKLRTDVKTFEKVFSKSGKELTKSYKDHASSVEEEHAIQGVLNSNWKVAQQRALDLRFELKESMTEEEWTELFSIE